MGSFPELESTVDNRQEDEQQKMEEVAFDIDSMVGVWKSSAGQYSLVKGASNDLYFHESKKKPLAGILVATSSKQCEGQVYKGVCN